MAAADDGGSTEGGHAVQLTMQARRRSAREQESKRAREALSRRRRVFARAGRRGLVLSMLR